MAVGATAPQGPSHADAQHKPAVGGSTVGTRLAGNGANRVADGCLQIWSPVEIEGAVGVVVAELEVAGVGEGEEGAEGGGALGGGDGGQGAVQQLLHLELVGGGGRGVGGRRRAEGGRRGGDGRGRWEGHGGGRGFIFTDG